MIRALVFVALMASVATAADKSYQLKYKSIPAKESPKKQLAYEELMNPPKPTVLPKKIDTIPKPQPVVAPPQKVDEEYEQMVANLIAAREQRVAAYTSAPMEAPAVQNASPTAYDYWRTQYMLEDVARRSIDYQIRQNQIYPQRVIVYPARPRTRYEWATDPLGLFPPVY